MTVARRDYVAAVQSRYFQICVLVVPLIMVGSGLLGSEARMQKATRDQTFAVIDRTPGARFFPIIETAIKTRNDSDLVDARSGEKTKAAYRLEKVEPSAYTPEAMAQQRLELSKRVRNEELNGFLEIGPDVGQSEAPPGSERAELRFQAEGLGAASRVDSFPRLAERAINIELLQKRVADAGLTLAQAQQVLQPTLLQSRSLSFREPESGKITEERQESVVARYASMMVLVMLIYMGILLCSSFLIQAVLEEKMQRIVEVLLGSVSPFQLMMGKLLGLGAVSFTLVAIYAGGLYWAAQYMDWAEYLPTLEIVPWFLVFFILGILLYGSVAMALGAASTDLKEVNVLFTPVVIVAALPLILLPFVQDSPHGLLALAFSFFPPTTPTFMMARLVSPTGLPWWQPVLAALLMVATMLFCVWAAGRVFRVGLLVQGKGARFHEIVQWIIHG
ncbi:MAG: ABC transporter permease [Gemmataceae bacterium]